MGSTKDKIKGAANRTAGKLKRGIGKATGNKRLRAEGDLQKAKGDVQKAAGKAKDAVKKRTVL